MSAPSPELAGLLLRLGDALGVATRPSSVRTQLTQAAAGTRGLFSAAACSIALADASGETLEFVAADGAGAQKIIGVQMSVQRGIAGWVVLTGQSIVVSDVGQDARFARDIAEATDYVPQSMMAAPLIDTSGEISGVLEVLDPRSGGEHTGRDLEILGALAAQVAATLELAQIYDGLGEALIRSLAGSESGAEFASALAELAASSEGADDLTSLAAAFGGIASTGPAGMRLAQAVLREVTIFAKSRR